MIAWQPRGRRRVVLDALQFAGALACVVAAGALLLLVIPILRFGP